MLAARPSKRSWLVAIEAGFSKFSAVVKDDATSAAMIISICRAGLAMVRKELRAYIDNPANFQLTSWAI